MIVPYLYFLTEWIKSSDRDCPKRVRWVVIRYCSTHEKGILNRPIRCRMGYCIEPHILTPKASGRPRVHSLREILDAIFYIVRSGCAWRLLPHDFPPWKTVHHYFRKWRIE
jgi:Putative transposase of IS4/5 family (DUF4096)